MRFPFGGLFSEAKLLLVFWGGFLPTSWVAFSKGTHKSSSLKSDADLWRNGSMELGLLLFSFAWSWLEKIENNQNW